jgi:hypothetical protein
MWRLLKSNHPPPTPEKKAQEKKKQFAPPLSGLSLKLDSLYYPVQSYAAAMCNIILIGHHC